MPIPPRLHTERTRAESFGTLAAAYDQARPGYPGALIDDLLNPRPHRVLDVGCGTGKASVLLRERGVDVLGVEVDARMAAVARESHRLAVEVGSFETWDAAGRRFDLIVCGQAWHWIDAVVGAARARTVLTPGGRLALFWNFAHFAEEQQQSMDEAYDAVAPELSRHTVLRGGGPATIPAHVHELSAAGFEAIEHRRYPWRQDYTTAQWVALMRTHSDHAALGAERLDELCTRVAVALDARGGGVRAEYVTELLLARRPPA